MWCILRLSEKRGLNPSRYCHFNRENNDSPVDGIGFPISRHCWTQRRMVQYCFCLAQLRSERVALVLNGGSAPCPKEVGPKTIKKTTSLSWDVKDHEAEMIHTWVIDVMSMSIMSNMSIMSMIVSITRSCYEDGVKATLCVSRQQRLGAPGFFELGIV